MSNKLDEKVKNSYIRVNAEVFYEFKMLAVKSKLSMKQIITDLMKDAIKNNDVYKLKND